jgi:tetratricopeptide (TPR) repeat protein
VQAIEVPPTVQAILAARIDRLAPEDKRLLQVASVVGKDVPFVLLQAIADFPDEALGRGLESLQGAEFLYETRRFPHIEYTFKHALTHEVTYGGLLYDRQRALHVGIVGAIERVYPDRLTEHVERLAHHAVRGEMWDQAVTYLRQAGVKALARSANPEAAVCFEQALTVLRHRPESRETLEQAIDLRFDLMASIFPLGEFQRILDSLREAEGLARRLDDQRRLAQLYIRLCHVLGVAAHPAEAIAAGENARAIVESLEVPLQVTANLWLGAAYVRAGKLRRAEDLLLNVLRLLEDEPRRRWSGLHRSTAHGHLTWVCAIRGTFAQGIVHGQEGLRLAEAVDHPECLTSMCYYLGYLQTFRGEFDEAIGLFERGLAAVPPQWNLSTFSMAISGGLGYAYALLGRAAHGIPLLERATSAFERIGNPYAQTLFQVLLGEAHVMADRLEDALEAARRGLTLAREFGQPHAEARALCLLGDVTARRNPPDDAEQHYRDALALAGELEMAPVVAHCHLGLGKLYRRTGTREQAQEHLATATTMYRDMGMAYWLEQAEVAAS